MRRKEKANSLMSQRIKQLREENKINQHQLAEILGVKNQTISNYEAGEREPSYGVLLKLADYFNVSTDFLLGRTNISHSDLGQKTEYLLEHDAYSDTLQEIFNEYYKFIDLVDKEYEKTQENCLEQNWDPRYWNYESINEIAASRIYEIRIKTTPILSRIDKVNRDLQEKILKEIDQVFDESRKELESQARAVTEEE
ncbi:helix-turn-helix domain-containing protein [Acetivibrio cellulolyticus]|uniref:helix-turn-helix domain-containing protein n=1 Tax=Acetivibrio cellulolyticus TaxID=35830 RepID=UPI0001E2D96B|nr:helix-turn-helix transcriptional regulator [Acetivibrio cellulolyticus]